MTRIRRVKTDFIGPKRFRENPSNPYHPRCYSFYLFKLNIITPFFPLLWLRLCGLLVLGLLLLGLLLRLHFTQFVFYLRSSLAYRDNQLKYEFVQQVEQEPI